MRAILVRWWCKRSLRTARRPGRADGTEGIVEGHGAGDEPWSGLGDGARLAIIRARRWGASWDQIGASFGVSGRRAQERWGRLVGASAEVENRSS